MQGKMRADLYPELYQVEDQHWWHQHKRAVVQQLIGHYAPKSSNQPLSILDIGSGTGKILEELQGAGHRVMGVDGEAQALQFSKQRGIKVKKVDLVRQRLPFNPHQFDVVLALDILEHLPNDKAVLNEMRRVLKPEGIIIVTVPAYPWLFNYWDRMLGHQRRYTTVSLHDLAKQARVKPVFLSYYFCLFLLPTILVRWLKQRFAKTKNPESDFKTTPIAWISIPLMNGYAYFERWWLRSLPLPFGLSVLLVGKPSTSAIKLK